MKEGTTGDGGRAAERKERGNDGRQRASSGEKEAAPPEDPALIRLFLPLLIGSQTLAGKFPLLPLCM